MSPTTLESACTAVAGLLGLPEAKSGLVVPAERHRDVAACLKGLGLTAYVTCVASHWPEDKEGPERHEVATVLRYVPPSASGRGSSWTFAWRVVLPVSQPIDSLVPLFAGADWQEREQYDLVGVRFAGHPDLRRLMMDEDWPGHPLRRDYDIATAHAPWR